MSSITTSKSLKYKISSQGYLINVGKKRPKFQGLNSLMRQMRIRSKALLGDGLTLPGRASQKRLFQIIRVCLYCRSKEGTDGWSYADGKIKFHWAKQVSSRGPFQIQLIQFCMKTMLNLPRVMGEGEVLGIFLLIIRENPTKIRTVHISLTFYPCLISKKSQ